MSSVADMVRHTPAEIRLDEGDLVACIEACFECVEACVACADACLAEETVAELRRCIAATLNCADVCSSTGRILARPYGHDAGLLRSVLEACREACRRCAEECEHHALRHVHCRICAAACRRCEQACDALLAAGPVG